MVSIFRAAIITAFAHKMVRVHCAMLLWLNVAIRQSTPHAKKNSNYSFDENRRRKSEDIRKRAMAGRQPQKFQPQNLHCIQNSIVLCARTFFICHENVSADWCMFRLFLICSRATFVRSARATGTHTHTHLSAALSALASATAMPWNSFERCCARVNIKPLRICNGIALNIEFALSFMFNWMPSSSVRRVPTVVYCLCIHSTLVAKAYQNTNRRTWVTCVFSNVRLIPISRQPDRARAFDKKLPPN